jgi:hypothetical protein
MRGEVRAGRREGMGQWRRKRHARGKGLTQGLGARARAGRTWNILCMSVTLEVSQLSGWLNADAICRVERRACDMGQGARPGGGGRGAVAVQAACTGKARVKAWGPGHARSAPRTCGSCP